MPMKHIDRPADFVSGKTRHDKSTSPQELYMDESEQSKQVKTMGVVLE